MNTGELTLETVVKRRRELIRYKLWDCFDSNTLKAWSKQFETDADKKIAMIALDALIVRTKDSAEAALWHFLCSVIPEVMQPKSILDKNGVISKELLRDPKYNIRFLRLEFSSSPYGTGQSSGDLIRILKYSFGAHKQYFQEPDSDSHLILIDEISGSGDQAVRSIKEWKDRLGNSYHDMSVFFLALHQDGYQAIETKHPDVNIYSAETLGKETSLAQLIIRNELSNNIIEAHKLITDFTKRNFIEDETIKLLGYGDMTLCYKPPLTACNNMAGLYLAETRNTNVRLFQRGPS